MENLDKIAVFTDEASVPADFFEATLLEVYAKKGDKWEKIRTVKLNEIKPGNISEIRKEALLRHSEISDLSIVCAKEIAGIPFVVFDNANYSIFTIDEISDELLDSIVEDVKNADVKKNLEKEMKENAKPVETGEPGYYVMDLISLQEAKPEITSKMAMQDFFKSTPFMELRLKCNHLPPWIERMPEYEIHKLSETEFMIRKKQCRE